MERKLFKVVITAIIVKDGKYLVLQRAGWEKKFPLRWTVPGGKLSTEDYIHLPKDTPDYWYNVLEQTLRREVMQESRQVLHPEGALLVYQFTNAVLPYLKSSFGSVRQNFQFLNILPARIFYCTP